MDYSQIPVENPYTELRVPVRPPGKAGYAIRSRYGTSDGLLHSPAIMNMQADNNDQYSENQKQNEDKLGMVMSNLPASFLMTAIPIILFLILRSR